MKQRRVRFFLLFAAAHLALRHVYGVEPAFPNNAVYGEATASPGEGLLAAFTVAVKLTAPGLRLREPASLGHLTLPEYPTELFDAGVVGEAEVTFDLKEDGRIEGIRVSRSTHAEFGEAALIAVKKWKIPALKWSSEPTSVRVTAKFLFSIYSGGISGWI
jgi:TonB family protein